MFLAHFAALITLLGLLFAAPLKAAAPATELSIRSEGYGEIKDGDTVAARKQAVDKLMRSAMRSALEQLLKPVVRSQYADMLDDTLVAQFGAFVRNYRVEDELGEGGNYRVRASVYFDKAKLQSTLQQHGMAPLELDPPSLLLLIVEQPTNAAQSPAAWWRDGVPANLGRLYPQDQLVSRMLAMPVRMIARHGLLQPTAPAAWQEVLSKLRDTAPPDAELALQAAQAAQAAYVAFGWLTADWQQGDVTLIRSEDNKFVGRLQWNAAQWKQLKIDDGGERPALQRRIDYSTYGFSGMLLRDWLERWQVERRLLLRFTGVRDLRQYAELLKALGEISDITSLREESFKHHEVTFRLGVAKAAPQLLTSLRQHGYFRAAEAVFTLVDEKHLDVALPQ